MEPKQRTFSMWYAVAAMLLFFGLQAMLLVPHPETVSYSEFKALVKAKKVSDLVLDKDTITGALALTGLEGLLPKERIEAIKRAGKEAPGFVTTRVEDPGLVPELEAAHIRYTGHVTNPWVATLLSWILPAVIFFGLWMLVMKRMTPQSGLTSLGTTRAKVYVEHQTGVSFDDIAGIDEVRGELMELVDFLKNPQRHRRLGGKIPKGVLLVGAPGTGKTLLAKAVAGEAGVPFFSMAGSDFVEMFVGVGAARVRDLFIQAQAKAPSIVFIDEFDAVGKARGISPGFGGHDQHEQTLNQLLAELDGFDTQAGVIILAATNRPEILDPALLRPGRFDRQIVIDRPDLKGPGEDLSGPRTKGHAGSGPRSLRHRGPDAGVRRGRSGESGQRGGAPRGPGGEGGRGPPRLRPGHRPDRGGLERKSRIISPKEKEVVAHHEAGHALVAESREHADRVSKISIIPRGVSALGYRQQQPTEDRYLMTRAELLDRLDVLLGGRVAEEIIFGDVSTGAHDDLQRASDLARHMVTQYGMSDALGLGTFQRLGRLCSSAARASASVSTGKTPLGSSTRKCGSCWRPPINGSVRRWRRSATYSRPWPSC